MNLSPIELLFLAIASLGHAGLTVAMTNRLGSTALPRKVLKLLDRLIYGVMGLVGLLVLLGLPVWASATPWPFRAWVSCYLLICAWLGLWFTLQWIARSSENRRVRRFWSDEAIEPIDIGAKLQRTAISGSIAQLATKVPGNQFLKLAVIRRTLYLPRLPAELEGIRLAHISDLHLTGRLTQAYYQQVVAEVNRLESDLITVTGDIFDCAECVSWVPECLGELAAPDGVHFILGNHDLRTGDLGLARQSLTSAGWTDIGSEPKLLRLRDTQLLLAGNERPWVIKPAAYEQQIRTLANQADFRVLLSHSPDQIDWAQKLGFQLVLAGHTHGGQIRLPGIGPIVAPSRYGVEFASGIFERPPAMMHVTRGVSSKTPLRLNCSPEVVQLTLRCRK